MLVSCAVACLVGAAAALRGNVRMIGILSLLTVIGWIVAGAGLLGAGSAVLGAIACLVALQGGYFVAQFAYVLGHAGDTPLAAAAPARPARDTTARAHPPA